MLKRLSFIFLITAFLLPHLTQVWIIIDFKLNQGFIAKVLCINKDKPTTKCNGKCYLSKQLRKAEEKKEKDMPNSFRERQVTTLYIQDNHNFPLDYITKNLDKTSFFEASILYASSYIDEIFHPPKLILI